jgi:hypothetical protein
MDPNGKLQAVEIPSDILEQLRHRLVPPTEQASKGEEKI